MAPAEAVAAGACAAAATAAAVALGAAAVARASPVASVMMTLPSLTLSPSLTRISLTTPESGAGTSIVAFSDSSETSGSSAFTVWPSLTKISITGTSLKSPMSGTRTSARPAGALTAEGGALTLGLATSAGAAAAATPSPSSSMITLPSLTLSPTFTPIDLTTPPCGAGTSIVAFSDSSEISGSSAFTVSPTLTKISITGTSLKSPMSGTRTSAKTAGALTGEGGALTTGWGT